jgi:hypothetical protein
MRPPHNVTQLDGWKVIFSKNSPSYNNISSILDVSLFTTKHLINRPIDRLIDGLINELIDLLID